MSDTVFIAALATIVGVGIVCELAIIASQLRRIANQLIPGNLQANIYDCTFDAGNQAGGRKL